MFNFNPSQGLPPLGDYTGGQNMYQERLNALLPRARAAGMNVNLRSAPKPHGSFVAPNLHQPFSPATGMDARAMFSGNRPASQGHFEAMIQGLRGAY